MQRTGTLVPGDQCIYVLLRGRKMFVLSAYTVITVRVARVTWAKTNQDYRRRISCLSADPIDCLD